MAEQETEYRTCLYCHTEIDAGRPNTTNFCNGTCWYKFRLGMSHEAYFYHAERNKLFPIRGTERKPPAVATEQRKADSQLFKLCKLSEYNLCNTKFLTTRTSKEFCHYKHQKQYNNIKYGNKIREQKAKQKEEGDPPND